MKIMRAATASDSEPRTNNAYCERSARQPGKRNKEIRHVEVREKSKSKVAGGGRERSGARGKEKRRREREGKAREEGGGGRVMRGNKT